MEDEVTYGEGIWDLKIASRNPKTHWKYPLTIRYSGEFFQVKGEEHVAFVEDDPPGFFATVYGEMRKKFAK